MNKNEEKQYSQMVKDAKPKGRHFANFLHAFIGGALVCGLSQGIALLYERLGAGKESAGVYMLLTLIALAALLTAFGVYDKLAHKAKAGLLVPITGFANAICSSAMEYKSEGFIAGTGAKLFSVSGPVIVYGVLASSIYGVILWIISWLS